MCVCVCPFQSLHVINQACGPKPHNISNGYQSMMRKFGWFIYEKDLNTEINPLKDLAIHHNVAYSFWRKTWVFYFFSGEYSRGRTDKLPGQSL